MSSSNKIEIFFVLGACYSGVARLSELLYTY
jgi:hypothetical protein